MNLTVTIDDALWTDIIAWMRAEWGASVPAGLTDQQLAKVVLRYMIRSGFAEWTSTQVTGFDMDTFLKDRKTAVDNARTAALARVQNGIA